MTGAMPAFSSVSYAFSPVSPTTSRTLTLTSLAGTANANGTVTERGTVKNTGTASASLVGAARTWYGRIGEVLDFRTTTVSPSTLARGKSGSFAVTRPVLTNVQSTRTQLRGR